MYWNVHRIMFNFTSYKRGRHTVFIIYTTTKINNNNQDAKAYDLFF